MQLKAYTIYDRKSGIYHSPFFAVSDGSAVRSFSDLANDPGTTVGRHPNDYVLYRAGGFDDQSGLLLSIPIVEHVTDANVLLQHQPALAAPATPAPVDVSPTNGFAK